MHASALQMGAEFFRTYLPNGDGKTIVDLGAQNVNGSLRESAPQNARYIGVDFVKGRGVDVVLEDPYRLPFEDQSADVVVCSSCLEHSEMFWVLFLEILRILKPHGLLYINVPSNGPFHRWPVDCWRFYPDSGNALVTWAERNQLTPKLLESFIADQLVDGWNDFVAVFVKDRQYASSYPSRLIKKLSGYTNAILDGHKETIKTEELPQDQRNFSYRLKRRRWKLRKKWGRIALR